MKGHVLFSAKQFEVPKTFLSFFINLRNDSYSVKSKQSTLSFSPLFECLVCPLNQTNHTTLKFVQILYFTLLGFDLVQTGLETKAERSLVNERTASSTGESDELKGK